VNLVVVRHAVAKDREAFARTGADDSERPLTRRGRREFKKGARGIARLVGDVDVLATSPLVRAVETAALLARALGGVRAVRRSELEPDASPRGLLAWLGSHGRRATVAVVGHEPHLSLLVATCAAGRASDLLDLDKGGACLLSFEGAPRPGGAKLLWLLTASQLRRLGR
jgi:phosphohistidine phosphatase